MYTAPADASIGEAEWRPFLDTHPFGHLIAAGHGRDVPVVVPTQFILQGDTVRLHLVRANPIFAALAENPKVLLSVAADWAFIPSDWKTIDGEDPTLGVPTTYYGAVQVIGTATVHDERDEPGSVAAVLRQQLAVFQPDVAVVDPGQAPHAARIKTILGISVAIESVTAKFKYGGNVNAEHRQAVVAHLRQRNGPGDAAAAVHTLRRMD
jgi:transcriptional regulator